MAAQSDVTEQAIIEIENLTATESIGTRAQQRRDQRFE
jgi:hypothetical protein